MFKDEDLPIFQTRWDALVQSDIQSLERMAAESEFPHRIDPYCGRRWLTHAISTGSLKSVDWVLSKGVEIVYVDDEGFSALKTALQLEIDCKILPHGKLEPTKAGMLTISMIDILVKAGVDVNQRLPLDYTALHVAAEWSSQEVVSHLLSLNADPFAASSDVSPTTPADNAKERKRWEVHKVLCDAMGLSPAGRPQ